MKKKAIFDLLLLLTVFWTSWLFRTYFLPVFQGAFVVISTSLIAVLIINLRRIDYRNIGFLRRKINKSFFKEVLTVSLLIFATQFIGVLIVGFLFGMPDNSSAVTHQPKSAIGFILDIVFMVWIVTAVGEEFLFRGIIINRLDQLFKNVNIKLYLISLIQAIWFGLGHQSQGLPGIIITTLIGFVLGIYIIKNRKLGLWPIIVAHGLIDTIVLTINFIS